MNYFKVLEISADATESEIKKAYFTQVRKYPPEKFPEKFAKIREAYEFLLDENNRIKAQRVKDIPEEIAFAYMKALEYESNGNFLSAINIMENLSQYDPGNKDILDFLGRLYWMNDETGKSANIYTKLLTHYPDDATILGNAAISYARRGFNKKAEKCFFDAYLQGNKSPDFLLNYANFLNEFGNKEASRGLFMSLLSETNDLHVFKESLCALFYAFEKEHFTSNVQKLDDLSVSRPDMLQKCEEELFHISLMFISKRYSAFSEDNYIFVSALERLKTQDEKLKQVIRILHFMTEDHRLTEDKRINTDIEDLAQTRLYQVVREIIKGTDDGGNADLQVLGVKLTVIRTLNELENQIEIIKSEYKVFAEFISEFLSDIDALKGTDRLWDKYRRLYCIAAGYPEDARLYTSEPARTNDEPKVGRNDPCPCGSGKKYKKCCGKNS